MEEFGKLVETAEELHDDGSGPDSTGDTAGVWPGDIADDAKKEDSEQEDVDKEDYEKAEEEDSDLETKIHKIAEKLPNK